MNQRCDQETVCFLCSMAEPDRHLRRTLLSKCFKEMPKSERQDHVLALSSLWKIAMAKPNDPEFPSIGVFKCMSKLIHRGIHDKQWLLRGQNIYIPYYAAHILGSYTLNNPNFAQAAVASGVIPPLLELFRGKLSWVETRAAVRALTHLARHEKIFRSLIEYEEEIVESAMEMASNCLEVVYVEFVVKRRSERLGYHCDLMTRGVGGLSLENGKAEEWACQIQSWSLALLDRFARNHRCFTRICDPGFLRELARMRRGIGLIRTLCTTAAGRTAVAGSEGAIHSLCNASRSLKMMAVESLLLILKDPGSRHMAIDASAMCLSDLVEQKIAGDAITRVMLQDYSKIKYGQQLRLMGSDAIKALEHVWEIKVERRKIDKLMSEEEIIERKCLSSEMRRQGNRLFHAGDVEGAMFEYSKALDSCPLRYRKERSVAYSNRAQCLLMLGDADGAISDATRAVCLSRRGGLSLWRRAQAYDIKGMHTESLMDCLMFLDLYEDAGVIPRHVMRMIDRQMNAAWVFSRARRQRLRTISNPPERGEQ